MNISKLEPQFRRLPFLPEYLIERRRHSPLLPILILLISTNRTGHRFITHIQAPIKSSQIYWLLFQTHKHAQETTMDAGTPLLDARIARPEDGMEKDLTYPSIEQLPLGSLFDKPEPQISYICSVIRIARTDEAVGTTQDGDHNPRYRIELLAPSAGLLTVGSPALQSCLINHPIIC